MLATIMEGESMEGAIAIVSREGELDGRVKELIENTEVWLATKRPSTAYAYRFSLRYWGEYLGSPERWLTATWKDAVGFVSFLRSKPGQVIKSQGREIGPLMAGRGNGLNDAAIAKHLSALRSVYGIYQYEGLVQVNPFDSPKIPRLDPARGMRRQTSMIPEDQVMALLDAPSPRSYIGIRDRALLAVFLGCGSREGETLNLRLEDVTHEQGLMVLRFKLGKGRSDRSVPLPAWAADRVSKLIDTRKRLGAEPSEFLFLSKVGRPLCPSMVWRLFRGYCIKAGLKGRFSPHSCRATVITSLLRKGVTCQRIQMTSGHQSIAMVERYNKARAVIEENPSLEVVWEQKES